MNDEAALMTLQRMMTLGEFRAFGFSQADNGDFIVSIYVDRTKGGVGVTERGPTLPVAFHKAVDCLEEKVK